MRDSRAIANFFIERGREQGVPLTVMTLLKVIYFAHAWYLAKYNQPLVAQPFEAWQYGPVNRVVYDQYKDYKDKPIDKMATYFDPVSMSYVPANCSLDTKTTKFLENIFDYYSQFHPFKLSDLTHEEDGPWHAIWERAEKQAVPGMVIPNEMIAAWFKEHGAVNWTNHERRFLT